MKINAYLPLSSISPPILPVSGTEGGGPDLTDSFRPAATRDKKEGFGAGLRAFAMLGLAVGVAACHPEQAAEVAESQQSLQRQGSQIDLGVDGGVADDVTSVIGAETSSHRLGNTIHHGDGTISTKLGDTVVRSDGSSSTRIGNSVIRSDGSSSTRVGNTVFNSDGSNSTRVGNTVVGSDGSTSTRIGNTIVNSDGTSSTRVGNTIIHSDGSTSTRIGNTIMNSDGTMSFDHGLGVEHSLWD